MIEDQNVEKVSTIFGEFYSWKGDLITEQLKKYSAHTRNEIAMLSQAVSPGDTVLDIGAHIGTFSLPFAKMVGDNGKVFSFEASVENYELLLKNIKENNFSCVVSAFNGVVSSDTLSIFKKVTPRDSNSGMSYFVEDEDGKIPSINVDSWAKENNVSCVSLIKIDVEGAEVQVLKSCSGLLKTKKPMLYIEICQEQLQRFSTDKNELELILSSNGYHFFTNIGERNSDNDTYNIIKIDSLDEVDGLFDVLCIHPDDDRYQVIKESVCDVNIIKGSVVQKIEHLFLSVGAMKAGTTWLYEQLKDHPEIHFTPEKEIHYFANKVGIENQLNHRNRIVKLKKILENTAHGNPKYISNHLEKISWYTEYARAENISNEWYQDLFRFKQGRKYCADFSNLYCQMGADGWDNVRKVAKNVKVIYTLRDPLERLWSHYKFHMKWVNREDEALDAGFENFKQLLDKEFFWINAEYSKNYNLLKKSLNNDELMLLYFEDFRERPEEMLAQVHRFLGIKEIPSDRDKLNRKVNKTKDFGMPEQWRVFAVKKLDAERKRQLQLNINHEDWS